MSAQAQSLTRTPSGYKHNGMTQVLPAMSEGICCRFSCCRERCKNVDLTWLRLIIFSWIMAGLCVVIALGLGSTTPSINIGELNRGDDVFFLLALGFGLYPFGKMLNWFLFKPVYWCSGPGVRDTFVYYASSFDGLLTHLFWIAGTWVFYIVVLNKDSRENIVPASVVADVEVLFIIMAVAFSVRTLLIKYAMASVLRRTYSEKTEQAILFKFFARTLSAPDEKLIANAGKQVETIITRVRNSKHSTQSYLRLLRKEGLLMWDHNNKLKKVTTSEKVREYAALAFERVYQRGIQRGLVPDVVPAGGTTQPGDQHEKQGEGPVHVDLHHDSHEDEGHEKEADHDSELHAADVIVPRRRLESTASMRSITGEGRRRRGSTTSPVSPRVAGFGFRSFGGIGQETKPVASATGPSAGAGAGAATSIPQEPKSPQVDGHIRHATSGQVAQREKGPEIKRRFSESDKSSTVLAHNPIEERRGSDATTEDEFTLGEEEREISSEFVRIVMPSSKEVFNKCMQTLDLNNDGLVNESEFIQAFVHMMKVFKGLRSTLSSYKSVSKAVQIASDVILWMFIFIVALIIFNVPLGEVFVPFSAILVAVSFAIGSTVQNLLASLLVVVVLRPFDVGDRVVLPYIVDMSMVVKEIAVLTTTFTAADGKIYHVPNSMLLTRHVINYRRSSTCVWKTPLTVGFNTTRAQIEELHHSIEGYLASKPREWGPDCSLNMDTASPLGEMTLNLWTSQRIPWSLGASAFKSRSDLLMFIVETMKELKITYVRPIQPVEVTGQGSSSVKEGGQGGGSSLLG